LVAGAVGAAEVGSEAAVAALAEDPAVEAVRLAVAVDPAVAVGLEEEVEDSEVEASAAAVVEPATGPAIAPR
jgi:hypothetical protein